MARADLILNLVKAGVQDDHAQFQKTIEAIAADERAKNHHVFADRLQAQLQIATSNQQYKTTSTLSIQSNTGPLFAELVPNQRLDELILPALVEQTIRELVEEQYRVDLLRSYNLEPRNRVLLAGPPGNGKTSLAEAIADELNIPFLVVRYEAIIGSYLGETAQRINQVFEYARSRHCILFFDEFDAVGKERGDSYEIGEIKRVVSSLLLQIDRLPSYVIIVVASNHPELLDRAVWRRFQVRLELPMPKQGQIEEWLKRFENRTGHPFGMTTRTLAQNLKGLSFAEVEEFGTDVLRRIVLSQPNANVKEIVKQSLNQWKKRFTINSMDPQSVNGYTKEVN